MYSVFKILFIILTAIVLAGCRSAKPTASYESMADSVTVMTESVITETEDTMSVAEKSKVLVKDAVEFVEGGGTVYVYADGSLSMTGVATVNTSRMDSSTKKVDSKIRNIQYHSNDSLVSAHTTSVSHEFKEQASSDGLSWKTKAMIGILSLLIFLLAKARLRRSKL